MVEETQKGVLEDFGYKRHYRFFFKVIGHFELGRVRVPSDPYRL